MKPIIYSKALRRQALTLMFAEVVTAAIRRHGNRGFKIDRAIFERLEKWAGVIKAQMGLNPALPIKEAFLEQKNIPMHFANRWDVDCGRITEMYTAHLVHQDVPALLTAVLRLLQTMEDEAPPERRRAWDMYGRAMTALYKREDKSFCSPSIERGDRAGALIERIIIGQDLVANRRTERRPVESQRSSLFKFHRTLPATAPQHIDPNVDTIANIVTGGK